MSFSQATLTSVNPAIQTFGGLKLSWAGTLPPGQVWQVYVGGALAGHTSQDHFHVPTPPGGQTTQIAIGTVAVADAGTSFAGSLPPTPDATVTLSWQGGRFQDPVDGDVMGFHVYGEDTPGGGIDYQDLLADIPVSTGGVLTDGFGLGGFGAGGFGYAAGTYQWTSGTLTSGTWKWSVRTYDSAGNEGPDAFWSKFIGVPPAEPPPDASGIRLHYTLLGYGQFGFGIGGYGEPEAVLTWLPSTG